jgi:hypothetical protein
VDVASDPELSPRPWATTGTVDFSAVPVAVGLALIAGALAMEAPFLNSLVLALAALALAGAFVERRGRYLPGDPRRAVPRIAAVAGAGLVAFFLLPPPVAVGRGLVLALSLLPLWLADGRFPRSAEPREEVP